MDKIKTCGNCKHFKIVKHGREVKKIIDSSYLISECRVKKWKTKEYYLLEPSENITENDLVECEFWEYWKCRKIKKQER